jgi:hypothetical protein
VTDATAPQLHPEAVPQMPDGDARAVYSASPLRKLVLSIVFMILLPFFASLPAMLYQRLSHGLWHDTLGLLMMAVLFTALMALVLAQLMQSLRSKVEIGSKTVRLTLPARGGVLPAFSYPRQEIPYEQIEAVELRREIYGGAFAPVLLRGARIVMKDGNTVPLGYVSEANVDSAFPFPEIGARIAAAAGRPLIDRGNVRRSAGKKVMGFIASDEENKPIPEDEIAALNSRHNRVLLALVGAMVLLLGAGLTIDLLAGNAERGERSATSVVVPPPKKK